MTRSIIIFELKRRWLTLRCFRSAGSVLVDYRIIQNYAKRLIAGTAK
ncbi:hypothetical protein M976_02868 [Buttiauxella ferragutiae ATCC 51602]|uniref:YlcG family protein n=1 Tax=Buttiauxella ferragutiae ATCC 51602 TaxID=1354252 RepID=A0ABX2W714_9ENTR|nr:YlcG family protein [Buttiauxella ferragutiae]OAT26707.1 hypothetical protein M976_02868 [Buttiauxella ferragutiae ATCC 51602]